MRYILSLAVLLSCFQAAAQPGISNQHKNELGIFAETGFGNVSNQMPGLVGLQYLRWSGNKAFRASLASGTYRVEASPFIQNISGDTVVEAIRRTKIPMVFIGAGVSMQRHFYKSVYLYAAVDLNAGYGNGSFDTSFNQKINGSSTLSNFSAGASYTGVHKFILEAHPAIGARIVLKRFIAGTEISAINVDYNSMQFPGEQKTSVMDMNAGNFTQRFYVDFAF